MRVWIRVVIALLTLGLAAASAINPATAQQSAPLTICNQTSEVLNTAVGYYTPGAHDDKDMLMGPFVTRGWNSIAPGACYTWANPFNARYMFWHGFNSKFNNNIFDFGGMQPQQPDRFCVTTHFRMLRGTNGVPYPSGETVNAAPFTYEAENIKDPTGQTDACFENGANIWAKFRSVDTWVSGTVNFTGQ